MALHPNELKEVLVGPSITLVTPFKEGTFELDEEGLAANTNSIIEAGLTTGNGALIASGSNGECYAMTQEERKRVIEIVVEEANGRVPVLVGGNHTSTGLAIDIAVHANKIGADGVMATPPYYLEPTQGDMVRFYDALCEAVDFGIMVYDIAEVAKTGMSDETLERICQNSNVVALKAGQPSFEDFAVKAHKFRDRLACFANCYYLAAAAYTFGAHGFVSGVGNAAPQIDVALHQAAVKGDWDTVVEMQGKRDLFFLALENMSGDYGSYAGITLLQTGAALVGRAGGNPRPPAVPFSAEDREVLRSALVAMGVA